MRTKQIIMDAAFRLFENKPFTKITVQDILEESGVSRKTFYKYFRDKFEVHELYYLEKAGNVFDAEHLPEHMDEAVWREMASGVLIFMKEHRSYYLNTGVEKTEKDSLWKYIRRTLIEIYSRTRRLHLRKDTLSQADLVTIQCFVESAMSLFRIMTFDHPELTVDQLLDIAANIIPEDFRSY